MKPYSTIMQEDCRIGGVLLHPTSLPSGQLDEDVFRWLDFMADAGLHLWQLLPLGVPQENLSPYQCYSAFAINPALLNITIEQPVDLFADTNFKNWYEQQSYWLNDYALFMTLKEKSAQKSWHTWPEIFKHRDAAALEIFQQQETALIHAIYWQQYQLYTRWFEVRDYASARNIYLFGDMPIFVAHDSADVWANQEYFLLDEQGMPTVVAGVPPDYFSATGQRWGNPHYNWERMQAQNFDWWLSRLRNHLELFDVVRIDHFRGLEASWIIDAESETAVDGYWQQVPGEQLLQCLLDEMGNVPLVAEDLGIITKEVTALREQFHLPGMSVMQFSFDGFDDNPHKAKNIEHDRVVYTGTHDNDTTKGWFESLDEAARDNVMQTLEIDDPAKVTDQLIDVALNSRAQLAIIPLQDFLNLGSVARMNTPGTMNDNWQWQFAWTQIPEHLSIDLKQRIASAGRLNNCG